jgi:hypothetical protein
MKLLRCLTMKRCPSRLPAIFAGLIFATVCSHAASDTDVTILKAETVLIESNTVTIIGEAKASVTLTSDDYQPDYKGDMWEGRPCSVITIKADKATFTIKRPQVKAQDLNGPHAEHFKATQQTFDLGWKMTVEAAKDLQKGKEVGRIGYYAPEIVLKGNLIHSINGSGFLYGKGK